MDPKKADTPLGEVEYLDLGAGDPVLFVHGSPGGADQAELMTRFLVADGFRVIAPSRPGYLGTPLTDDTATPDAQARLFGHLLDSLDLPRVGVACWSGGGPSSYRLAATAPGRVTSIVAIAAVSSAYTFATSMAESLMNRRAGAWVLEELAKHSPKALIRSTLGEEGSLSKDELAALTDQVWDDPEKKAFVLDLSATIPDRRTGLHNDHEQFPKITDLGLAGITAPTLLVHGTADTDVPPAQSNHAKATIPDATLVAIDGGTHIAVWTDPVSADSQARIAAFLRPS